MNATTQQTVELKVPFPRSFWVVPRWFLAGFYPGDLDAMKAREKIHALLDVGIRAFVDLTHPQDVDHSGQPMGSYALLLERVANERGVRVTYHRHPIPDTQAPSTSEMQEILNQIDFCIANEQPVYVHCWGGRGRTGTVVGCYLSRHRIAVGWDALERLAELRAHEATAHIPAPDTAEQRRCILMWPSGA